MKNTYLILLLGFILMNSGCYKDTESETQFDDEFFLTHKGADLPIWVRGNKDAKTFILFLHGGPFDTALYDAVVRAFEPLYDDYAVVYFDQRGGGHAHGSSVNLSEAQFVEDVELVTKLVKQQYPQAENLFLMGHSYGGYLGTAVLAKGNNQDLFKGWISLAGAHNYPLNWVNSRAYLLNITTQKISAGEDLEVWQERFDALTNTPEVTNINELRIINGIAFQVAKEINAGNETFEKPPFLFRLTAPTGAGFSQHNNAEMEDLIVNGNLNPVMSNITLPSLLIYGGEDPIVPFALGNNAIDFLGTPEEDKFLISLATSGHILWEYQADIFFDQIRTFVSSYE